VNGQGTATNVRIIDNECTSTGVRSNIAIFDTDRFWVTGNRCSGARTIVTSGGYGIVAYQTSHNPGALKSGVVSGNVISNTEGAGIYLQGLVGGGVVDNDVVGTGTLETDGTLPVGGISVNGCTHVTVSGGSIRNSGKDGLVVVPGPSSAECRIKNVTVNTAGAYGVHIRGKVSGLVISGVKVRNTTGPGIANDDNGASTAPVDHVSIKNCAVVKTLGAAVGIGLFNASYSSIGASTVDQSGGFGISDGSGGAHNIVSGNTVTDADGADATYYGLQIATSYTLVKGNRSTPGALHRQFGGITASGDSTRVVDNTAIGLVTDVSLSRGATEVGSITRASKRPSNPRLPLDP
jgi:hypothetical protein